MMNLAEGVLGQILTAVLHMALLMIQLEGLCGMLYPHTTMIWIEHENHQVLLKMMILAV